MISRAHRFKNLAERVAVAPDAVTTGHCQIHLRPGGAVTPLPLVDPGQSPDWGCGGEVPGSPRLLHFTIPKNELKSHVVSFKLQYKSNSNSFV